MTLRIVFAALRARRVRLALGMLVVAVGVAVSVALGTLALEAGDDFARTLRAAGPNFVVQPIGLESRRALGGGEVWVAQAGAGLPPSAIARLKSSFWKNNLLDAAPEVALPARVGPLSTTLIGTWFEHEVPIEGGAWRTGLAHLRPHWSVDGRWPRGGDREVALGQDLARRLGRRVGEEITVEAQGARAALRISGIVHAGGLEDGEAWTSLESLGQLTGADLPVDRIWLSALVKPEPPGPPPDPARDPKGYERYMCTAYPVVIAHDLGERLPEAEVLPIAEVVAGEAQVVRRLDLLMLMLALAALGASVLGLISTTTATVVERRAELALLRSLGASASQTGALLLAETLLVSLSGGMLGWVGGGLGAMAIAGHPIAASSATPMLLPVALFLATLLAVLGTIGPMRAAMRLDPAAALRA